MKPDKVIKLYYQTIDAALLEIGILAQEYMAYNYELDRFYLYDGEAYFTDMRGIIVFCQVMSNYVPGEKQECAELLDYIYEWYHCLDLEKHRLVVGRTNFIESKKYVTENE